MASPDIQEIINAVKADLTADYMSTQGALLPLPLAREIIVKMAARPTLLNQFPIQIMTAQIEPVGPVGGFVGSVSIKDVPGVSSEESDRAALDISSQILTCVNYKAVTYLNFQVERENILKQGIGNFVRDRLAEAVALDVEKLILNADLLSADTKFLGTNDGIIKQATTAGYVLDYSDSTIEVNDYPWYHLHQTIDPVFLQDKANCMYLVNPRAEGAYAMYLQRAKNALGNRRMNPDYEGQLEFFGIPIRRCYNMPEDTMILVPRNNVKIGFFQQIGLLTQTFVDPGIDIFVMRYSMDVKYVQPAGVAILKGLEVGTLPTGNQFENE
jgi:hypothetical protein